MAIIVEKAARGNAPATGMQKSKAPTRPAPPGRRIARESADCASVRREWAAE